LTNLYACNFHSFIWFNKRLMTHTE
jgi:hypothetical protein